jgi:WASH complex subunit 7
LGVYLSHLYQSGAAALVPLAVAAWSASTATLFRSKHTSANTLVSQQQTEILQEIRQALVAPLCRDIETELRLTVHHQAGLQVDDRNPFSQPAGTAEAAAMTPAQLLEFLHLPALMLPLGQQLCLRTEAANYLERTFYNLTTVSPADWRTYGEMRQLAASRFGLPAAAEDHLPAGTLEQGLDLLEVMRNIGRFTAAYSYNLHGQLFVQRSSSNKHLNTLNVRFVMHYISVVVAKLEPHHFSCRSRQIVNNFQILFLPTA